MFHSGRLRRSGLFLAKIHDTGQEQAGCGEEMGETEGYIYKSLGPPKKEPGFKKGLQYFLICYNLNGNKS